LTARTLGKELRFQLLGQLAVRTEDRELQLGSPKQKAVLAVLLLHANEIVPTDRIVDMVWGDHPPRTAEHSVQIYISELRKALSNRTSSDMIDTRPPGYVINVPPEAVDTFRFERLVRDGLSAIRAGDMARGRLRLTKALEIWTSDPLADFAYEDFAQGHIRSLTELRSDALEALALLELDQGDFEAAREVARSALESDPLREEPRRVMMLALYHTGRQAEALRHFAGYQRLLADELGVDSSEALRDLEERILLHDPSLDIERKVSSEGNPYRGLRFFSEDDADVYFGRESLVEGVLDRLRNGPGFVSIVGPSGSGKSSAARAGVTPTLRAAGETVVIFQPGSRPLWELAGALDKAGLGSRATLLRRFETDPSALVDVTTRPIVLVIDQFEELFTLSEYDAAVRFSELISGAIRSHRTPLRVVATLRADYYDKPLSMPSLAGVFSDSVVSVKPMTPQEIERAVVEPARAAGVRVEPALLAQLVADMGDEPGALPLLQFTLFQMFEDTSNGLTLMDYQKLGGIHGALTGGADELLAEFNSEERELAEQLMMRMIQKGRALSTARPVAVRDLVDLGVDTVALHGVLEAFAARRLITFDRDATGAAIVEMAHEFLISEWPQMGDWLAAHADDLDRIYAIESASADWVEAERSSDYLLRGERLERFETWTATTSLRLTRTEREFLEASVGLRDTEEARLREQAHKEEALRKSARRRLWAFGGAVAALAGAVTLLVVNLIPAPPPDVILWSESRDGVFGEMIHSGYDRAVEEHGVVGQEFLDLDLTNVDTIDELVERGTGLVILTNLLRFEARVHELIASHPEATFIWLDCQGDVGQVSPNEWCITSRHLEMGFLAGAVAGLTTENDHVGILVGVDVDFMHPFQDGFEQGAEHVNPDVAVSHVYLSSNYDGFSSYNLGYLGSTLLIDEGVDVLFAAAGESGLGMFSAVYDEPSSGRQLWSIGVDADEHAKFEVWRQDALSSGTAEGVEEAEYLAGLQSHIVTSVVKRLDSAIYEAISNYLTTGEVGLVEMTIATGGLDYVTSNGQATKIADQLEEIKVGITDGSITITPAEPGEIRLLLDLLLR